MANNKAGFLAIKNVGILANNDVGFLVYINAIAAMLIAKKSKKAIAQIFEFFIFLELNCTYARFCL